MSTETADTTDKTLVTGTAVFEAMHLEEADEVHVAREGYEWANPLVVQDVDTIEWVDADGEVQFGTAHVELVAKLEGHRGDNPHIVRIVSGGRAEWQQGPTRDRPVRFDPVHEDNQGEEDDAGDETEDADAEAEAEDEAADADEELSIDERRDYDQDLVVENLDVVSELRGRSLRQQVRQADDDVSDEDLAVQIGATVGVVQELREEVATIEARTDGGER